MEPVADLVSGFIFYSIPVMGTELPLIVAWLVAGGLFFTTYLRLINFAGFTTGIRLMLNPAAKSPGEISAFQALATAISGTVGIGNIAGVAIAISLGGPGATFWLMLAGFLGMATKFAECTLAVRFRETHADGSVSGGPMYYLRHGLAELGFARTGRVLGAFYAAAMVVGCLGIGNMFQANQATSILIAVTGNETSPLSGQGYVAGIIMAAIVGLVTIGGIKSIARVTEKLVPFMALLYVIAALTIIALNLPELPRAISAIIAGAFSPAGIEGGIIGVIVIGFRRAVFSNEAGLGSAAIAHSAVRTRYPATEGYVALLEPFIDTVVICTLTSLVIITTIYDPALAGQDISGIEMTNQAFRRTLEWSPVPLAIAAILFAFSTMISWSYYGLKAFTYLAGESTLTDSLFKLVFCSFIVIGSAIQLDALINLSDALVFVVAIPNLLGLYLMAPYVREEIGRFLAAQDTPQD